MLKTRTTTSPWGSTLKTCAPLAGVQRNGARTWRFGVTSKSEILALGGGSVVCHATSLSFVPHLAPIFYKINKEC